MKKVSLITTFAICSFLLSACGPTGPAGPKIPEADTQTFYFDLIPYARVEIGAYLPARELDEGSFDFVSKAQAPSGNEFTSSGTILGRSATRTGATRYCSSLGKSLASGGVHHANPSIVSYYFNCR